MKRKTKIAWIIVGACFLIAAIGISIWLIVTDVQSRQYNLIVLKGSEKSPAVVDCIQSDVVLPTGVTMHYARYGMQGDPLILIHGNGGSHHSLEELAYYFADEYSVYAIDSRCQGESSVTDKISYELMAADVNAFCATLNIVKPLVIGHSDGGIVALRVAMDYPNLMKAFVACGANSTPDRFKAYFRLPIEIRYSITPKELDRIMIQEPDFSATDLAKITCPAFIVAGEFDIMDLSDTAFIADSISGAQIAIVKWAGHSYIRSGARGYQLCKPFFDSLLPQ